jgi:hypothetical protein
LDWQFFIPEIEWLMQIFAMIGSPPVIAASSTIKCQMDEAIV